MAKRILVIIALCFPLLMQAQSIEHILKSIRQNNKELRRRNMPPMRPRWKTGQTTTCLSCSELQFFYVMVLEAGAMVRNLSSQGLTYSAYCPQSAGYLVERSGGYNNRLPAGIFC